VHPYERPPSVVLPIQYANFPHLRQHLMLLNDHNINWQKVWCLKTRFYWITYI